MSQIESHQLKEGTVDKNKKKKKRKPKKLKNEMVIDLDIEGFPKSQIINQINQIDKP